MRATALATVATLDRGIMFHRMLVLLMSRFVPIAQSSLTL
jgi:hypothetical protein